ncbi:unnamed protein product [Prorocentrum cordatum]|uniref:Uncharacterized protein n=1 Tax=Prorocentrum cordatum TaxID=2364126 RepID=A0ABN9XEM1_9DINO|nr:unnamed protein product [Polarella glacialis]
MLLGNGLTVRHTFIDVGPHGAGAHKRSASWPRSTVDVAAEEEDPPTSAAVSPAAAEQPPPKPRWADLESEAESVRSTGGRPSTPHAALAAGRQDTPTALERTRSAPAWPTTATGARRYVPPPARAYAQGGWAGGAASSMAAAAAPLPATAAPWHAPAGAVAAIAGPPRQRRRSG